MKQGLMIVIAAACLVLPLSAQKKGRGPNAGALLDRAATVFAGVTDFVCSVEANVNMEQVRIPRATATMYFKQPDRIHFNSSSIAMLPRDGMTVNPVMLRDRYEPVLEGSDTLEGIVAYRLRLTAKAPSTRLRLLTIWIEPAHWTILKTEAAPYEGRLITTRFTYREAAPGIWLPATLTATLGLTGSGEKSAAATPLGDVKPELAEMQRAAPRTGSVTVTYSNYKVNVGLPDEIFEHTAPR